MAILLTSESARPPAALVDGDLLSIVERLERDPKPVALVREAGDAELAAGGGRKGKRAEYQCAACGYGIVVFGQPPSCPLCSEARWEHVEWRPFSQLPDFPLAPAASDVSSTRLPSPTAEEPIRYPRPARASLEE